MVARAFIFARGLVDGAGRNQRPERVADQDMVNSKPAIATEGHFPVVPPGVAFLGLLKQAEGITEAQIKQRLKVLALLAGVMNGLAQGHRVVAVAVVGGDVEVAQQHQIGVCQQFPAHPVAQAIEPFHLVGKLLSARLLAIDKIAVDQAYLTTRQLAVRNIQGGSDHARLLVVEACNVFHDVACRRAAQNGDAVIGFLAKHRALVARILKLLERKLVVAELELLQAQGIDRMGRQPVKDLRQPHRQRVDVPGGEFHGLHNTLMEGSIFMRLLGVACIESSRIIPRGLHAGLSAAGPRVRRHPRPGDVKQCLIRLNCSRRSDRLSQPIRRKASWKNAPSSISGTSF